MKRKILLCLILFLLITTNRVVTVFADDSDGFIETFKYDYLEYRIKINSKDSIVARNVDGHPNSGNSTHSDPDLWRLGYYAVDNEAEIYLLENREWDDSDSYSAIMDYDEHKESVTRSFLQFKNPDNDIMIKKMNDTIRKIAQEYIDSGEYRKITLKDYESIKNGYYKTKSYLLQNDRYRVAVALNGFFPRNILTFNGAGDVLTLGDIFKVSKNEYIKKINDICFETIFEVIKKQVNDTKDWRERLDFREDIKSNWKIGRESITIYLPGVTTTYDAFIVYIPFSALADILEDEYLK